MSEFSSDGTTPVGPEQAADLYVETFASALHNAANRLRGGDAPSVAETVTGLLSPYGAQLPPEHAARLAHAASDLQRAENEHQAEDFNSAHAVMMGIEEGGSRLAHIIKLIENLTDDDTVSLHTVARWLRDDVYSYLANASIMHERQSTEVFRQEDEQARHESPYMPRKYRKIPPLSE